MHPILNCRDACDYGENQMLQDFVLDEYNNGVCRCSCRYCQSGVTVPLHLRMDCIIQCEHSPLIR